MKMCVHDTHPFLFDLCATKEFVPRLEAFVAQWLFFDIEQDKQHYMFPGKNKT
jgi:hypothetical protein